MPFRHFLLFPAIFLLSGCLGLGSGGSDRYGSPTMPLAPQVTRTISLAGAGAGATTPASEVTSNASANDASIGPQLEALTSEIRSLSGRFEAMEPAINRLIRVEQDMTQLIAEMELLANDPVPFTAPADLFATTREVPATPLAGPLGTGPVLPQSDAQTGQPVPLANLSGLQPGLQEGRDNTPVLSLELLNKTRGSADVGGGLTLSQQQMAQGSLAENRTGDEPADGSPAQALPQTSPLRAPLEPALALEANQAPGGEPVIRMASVSPQSACDAYGIHVGSYLLNESIAYAEVAIRERHSDVMAGLRYSLNDVNLGDGRGTFHRLIAGPVASYDQAIALCSAVETRGDYCMVTFFDPPECRSSLN